MNLDEINALENFIDPEEDPDVTLVFSFLKSLKTEENNDTEIKFMKYLNFLSTIFFNLFIEENKDPIDNFKSLSIDIEFNPKIFYNDIEIRRVDYSLCRHDTYYFSTVNYISIVYKWPDKDIPNSSTLLSLFFIEELGENFIKYVIKNCLEKLFKSRSELNFKTMIIR